MSKETPLKKLYFNMYVAAVIRNRQDFEAINTDLLYFTLLMKMNQYAKEVYFTRKAKTGDSDMVMNHLKILRKFTLDFYEIKEPNWRLIQNELEDPLEALDSLPVEEDPFGDKKTLDSLASGLSGLSLDEERLDCPSPTPLERTDSLRPDEVVDL
jgi:hypothetical protein